MQEFKLAGMIVDKDGDRRTRLRQVVRHSGVFNKLLPMSGIEPALAALSTDLRFDVIFIADSFEKDTGRLLKQARENNGASMIVLVVQGRQLESFVTGKVLEGVNAVLIEPYSVDSVREVCTIASAMKALQREKCNYEAIERLVKA